LDDLNTSLKCNDDDKYVSQENHEVYLIGVCSVVNLILGNLDHSNKSFEKLIKLGNKNVELLFEGILQLHKHNYQQSLDTLDKIDSSSIALPFEAYMSATQGFLCWKLNQSDRALVEINSALKQSPLHEEWNMWKAALLLPYLIKTCKLNRETLTKETKKIQEKDVTLTAPIGTGRSLIYNGTMVTKRKFVFKTGTETVAVKKIHLRLLTDDELEDIRQEIALHWFLSQNVGNEYFIKMLGWSTLQDKVDGTCALIVMEMADCNLSTFIFESDKQSPKEVQQLGLSIAKGVQVLHNYNVAHRDLKPQNILVIKKPQSLIPQLKLCDFGISRTQTTMRLQGTSNYLAPEIPNACRKGRVPTHEETISADIWSIGLVILFCISQQHPEDKLIKFITKRCVDVPASLHAVIRKCLETNAAIRFKIEIVVKELLALSL